MESNLINVNPQMQKMAVTAVSTAKDKFGVSLDYTENSLQQLELLLQLAHERYKQTSNSDNVSIDNTVRVWGSYFGEVIRRSMGGDWIVDQKNVFLQSGDKRIDPLGQMRSRIVDGPQYKVQTFFQGLKLGTQDNLKELPNAPIPHNSSFLSSSNKGNKNRTAIYLVGIIGTLIIVGLCVIVGWILFRQGALSLPLKNIPLESLTPISSPTPIAHQKPTPSQEMIDGMLNTYWIGGAVGKKDFQVTDYAELPLSNADRLNGVQYRVCLGVYYVEKDPSGVWKDNYISLVIEKQQDKWDIEPNLKQLMDINPFTDFLFSRIFTSSCDWARSDYGGQ